MVVVPGPVVVVDEVFRMWYGRFATLDDDGQHRFDLLPHSSYIPDKPRGQGVLFKCLADGWSRAMLKLEIQEGKERMLYKEFQARTSNFDRHYLDTRSQGDIHKYHTAVTLRLTRHLENRVFVGD